MTQTGQQTAKGDSWLRDITNEGPKSDEQHSGASSSKHYSAARCGASTFERHNCNCVMHFMHTVSSEQFTKVLQLLLQIIFLEVDIGIVTLS